MIKLVIFDLDGTLLYTIKDITVALNYALKKSNLQEVTIEEAKYMVGSGVDNLIKKAISDNLANLNQVKSDYQDYYINHNHIYTNCYQGIMHLVKVLKQANIKLAVLSNKPDEDTKQIIKFYFNDLFDLVVGARSEVKLKPDSEQVEYILDYFKVAKEETLYLGDSEIDVATAKNAIVNIGACLWGYRKKEELQGANIYFNSPKEIENYCLRQNNLLVNGAIILDKASGISSQDAILEVKHKLARQGMIIEKIGHAGTLDPLASGVLVVLINEATKLSNYLLNHDKEYTCTCKLGIDTDTYDIEGSIVNTSNKIITSEELDLAIASFKGKQAQVPPNYSAIKIDGKKAYDLARSGKDVNLTSRDITIYDIHRTTDLVNNEFSFDCCVSKGTYIRSICHDLGIKLGSFGTVKALTRVSSGPFSLDSAYTTKDIENGNYEIIKMEELLDLKKVFINYDLYKKISDGKALTKLELGYEMALDVALIYEDKLVAIYYYDENTNRYKARRVWK